MSETARIIDGKYQVLRRLGVGGMGEVFLATHLQLDQLVAIKILKSELTTDPVAVERFLREARAAARIQSDHVVRVFDVATLDDRHPYIVMEYLEGEDLAQRLDQGPLPTDEAIDYVLQACVAIAEAHRVGVIHRDLKPGNLFLSKRRDGSTILKVVDFGISKVSSKAGRAEASLTTTSHMMGSPFYMSPEQLRGEAIDVRTDVWALGMILFELLTAEGPFDARTIPEMCMQIIGAPARRLSQVRPDAEFPHGLQAVIDGCLTKDVASRYADVVDLAAALTPFARGSSVLATTRTPIMMPTKPQPARGGTARMPNVGVDAVPPAPAATSPRDDGGRVTSSTWDTGDVAAQKHKKKRRVALVVAAAGVALALAVVATIRVVGSRDVGANATTASSETIPLPPPPSATVVAPAPSASSSAPPVVARSASVVPSARTPIAKPVTPTPTAGGSDDEFGGRK